MQDEKKKTLLWCLGSALLAPVIFLGASKLLAELIEIYVYDRISIRLAFSIVLGFDIAWIIIMILCPLKNMGAKIALILFVLTLSAAILWDLLVIDALSAF